MVDLSRFDDAFMNAPPPEKGGGDVPDGKYNAKVERVEVKESREDQIPMLAWQLKIWGPTNQGRCLFKNSLINESGVPYLKEDLRICGFDVENFKLSQLESNLNRLLDLNLSVTAKTNSAGTYQNIYINELLLASPEGSQAQQETQDAGSQQSITQKQREALPF